MIEGPSCANNRKSRTGNIFPACLVRFFDYTFVSLTWPWANISSTVSNLTARPCS
jgi:hypothetical protein